MSAAEEVVTEAPAVDAVPKRAMTLGLGTSLVVLALLLSCRCSSRTSSSSS